MWRNRVRRFGLLLCLLSGVMIAAGCSKEAWKEAGLPQQVMQSTAGTVDAIDMAGALSIENAAGTEDAAADAASTAGTVSRAEDAAGVVGTAGRMNTQAAESPLPVSYDARQYGKVPNVKNQEQDGNCWAYAALSALEVSLLPEYPAKFSTAHLAQDWSPYVTEKPGGDYTMSMAYLLSWRGPVLADKEENGPACHLQEVHVIEEKDICAIKQAVWKYGGVETSFYSDFLINGDGQSKWYQTENHAYCCMEENEVNHDIVILGWDDTYPKENFLIQPESDGAFLCLNSWGEQFGENGYFYVSYEDTGIGRYAVAYAAADVDGAFQYQHLYETDACGWMGQIGYNREDLWFANIYTAERKEELAAAGFYIVEAGSTYEVFVKTGWENPQDFSECARVASGTVDFKGYLTVPLEKKVSLSQGMRFAVIVKVHAPSGQAAAAVELQREDRKADTKDGEGYLSWNGSKWQRAEEVQNCNLCLKAYTVEP